MTRSHYPIGTPGKPWTDDDKRTWFQTQTIKRSYQDEVLTKLTALDSAFDVFRYGALPIDENRYPLMAVRVRGCCRDATTTRARRAKSAFAKGRGKPQPSLQQPPMAAVKTSPNLGPA